jgi:hypothetical protein
VSADYSNPGVAKVRTESDWEKKCRDIVEGCGIIGIGDVIFKVRSPIPHVDLNDMLIRVSCPI